MTMPETVLENENSYLTSDPEICGGSPVIAGTRIRVIDIAIEHCWLGKTPDEIIDAHPHLSLAQVHAALSYYYRYQAKFDAEMIYRLQKVNELKRKSVSKVRGT